MHKNLQCKNEMNVAFRKPNNTNEIGMQIEKCIGWSKPETTPQVAHHIQSH
jgi:hypothetical protein